ncbi:hypothetical protein BT69DRAFT_1283297 [Atractiella rhizophila]|nr:hypothetical protein BT69DRAFT_1283297 [Atractiella rhizophila]
MDISSSSFGVVSALRSPGGNWPRFFHHRCHLSSASSSIPLFPIPREGILCIQHRVITATPFSLRILIACCRVDQSG